MLPIAERMEALWMVWVGMERVRARRRRSVCVVALLATSQYGMARRVDSSKE